jgi:NAD(P)-dependent dehydrogenase (short-subunit alcohol dehydrogenase family)
MSVDERAGVPLLAGKVALVTGGAMGIGAAAVRLFAREGAKVVFCDLDAEAGGGTLAGVRAAGGDAAFVRADVTREDDVRALVEHAVGAYGRLDCALNNAGTTGESAALQEMTLDAWRQVLEVNLTGVFLCMKHELRVMVAQKSGAIVNVASGAGVVASPYLAAYAASKHGVLGLTKTAAVENARSGVRVNAILPGSTDTPLLRRAMERHPGVEKMILRSTASGRLGRPEEVAEAALWLCSDRAALVSGESMLVDGASVAR